MSLSQIDNIYRDTLKSLVVFTLENDILHNHIGLLFVHCRDSVKAV